MSSVEVRTYRNRVLWGPFETVTASDLDNVERSIGRALPSDFREFILLANGGTLPYAISLPPGDQEGELLEFSDLNPLSRLPEGWSGYPGTVMAEHLPALLLEVARDGGGSTLYLDLGQETFGSVWAFAFGLPAWTGRRETNMGGQVAPSWNAYLDLLVIDEDYAREVWEEAQEGPDEWAAAVVA